MALMRRLGVVVLVVALTTTLFGANLALGVERTVLDAEFVTSTLEEEGAYDDLLTVVRDQFATAGANATQGAATGSDGSEGMAMGGGELPFSPDELVEEVITPAYLRSQVEANVEGTLGYLHGESDELVVAIDLRPVKARAGDAVTADIGAMEPAELFGLFAGNGTVEVDSDSGPSMGLVARLARNESSYEATRAAFRASVVETAVADRSDAAFRNATDDELLALVIEDYDPDEYDAAEKAAMVDEREPEIRAALEARAEAAVEDEVDDLLAARQATLRDEVTAGFEDSDVDPALEAAFREVALLGVDGLAGDLSYEEFDSRAHDARDTLATALSAAIVDGLESDVPDEMDLTADLDPSARESLSSARTAVGILDALAVVLWVLAIALVGALWWLGRSVATTTAGAGIALLAAGSPVALATRWAAGRLRTVAPTDPAGSAAFDLVVPIVDRVLTTVGTQSLLLAVAGLLLVGFGLAVRYDLLPEERPWESR